MRSTARLSLALLLVLAVVAPLQHAAAQITLEREPNLVRTPPVPPAATGTVRAYDLVGSLEGRPIVLNLGSVSVAIPWRWVGLNGASSSIGVRATQGVTNGTFAIVMDVPHVNAAGHLQVLRGGTVVGQCALQQQLSYAATAPRQKCTVGGIAVTDGKLELMVRPAQSIQVSVDSISVLRFP